jgi:rSAM/selenodomain-associated transferase 1
MQYPEAAVLVMARAPVPGEAKTRLISALGEEGAAALHAQLLERLLAQLAQVKLAPVTLCCTPDINHPFFHKCRERYGVVLQPQQGRDLGERLHHALSTNLQHSRYAVVIGCDIPVLGEVNVTQAIEALSAGYDAAISPTEDGGYALLAIRQPSPELFQGIEWGSDRVMEQTRQRFIELKWRWLELEMLWDVDRPEDLERLARLNLAPQIQELLSARPLNQ